MKNLIFGLALWIASAVGAFAVCSPPAVMHDFPGTAFNMSMVTAADGNCASSLSIQSGGVASGAIASGAVASGAIASGAVASGAFASGSLASGAGTDGWDVTEGTKADAAWV